MSNIRTIHQVAPYKSLSRCGREELAAHQRNVQQPSGGVLFARNTEREQKDLARERILDLFVPAVWPGDLRILTMPGLDWKFERKLLGSRERTWMYKLEKPKRTRITSIENDRMIYYAAIAKMPGLDTRDALTKILTPPAFIEHSVKTKFIKRFYFGNVDDLMMQETTGQWWDVAWLDFTGPMTEERLKIIKRFYHRSVRHTLILTVLKARWTKDTSVAIEKAGGHSEWLCKHLPGRVLHDLEYNDTSPMAQFAVCHVPSQ